jgi:hypothetical protein
MDRFFDELSRKLAAATSRRNSLLLLAATAVSGFLAACNQGMCSSDEVVCANKCCSQTSVCCNIQGSTPFCCSANSICCTDSGNYCCAVGSFCNRGTCA